MWEYKLVNFKLSIPIQLLCRMRRKLPALFAPIAPMGLVALIGMGGAFWLVTTAIAPLSVQAYTAKVDVSIDRQLGESYQTLLRRAEAIASAATQRSFDRDILVTDVSVMVLIQSEGAIAPILSLEATRQGWRSRPDPHRWITYYPTTESLLRLQDTTQFPNGQQRNSASPYSQPSSGYPVVPVPPATINPNTQPSATPRRPNRGTQPQVVPLPTQTTND
jgi:hypothetical protein